MAEKSLRRNKMFGRVKQPFGIKPSMLIGIMSVFGIGALLSFFLPQKVAWSIFAILFFSALIILSNGGGAIFARLHKPRHYTRAGDIYRSPLSPEEK